ncbi:MAG: hypothetical protein RJA70_1821 [Pseudomonadota bacterium]|jgi:hypothetical protein
MRRKVQILALLLLNLAFLPRTSRAQAGAAFVSLGEISVSSQAEGGRPTLVKQTFEQVIVAEFRQLERSQVRSSSQRSFVLATTLLELRTLRSGKNIETSCVVSAILRDADGGAIQSILKGAASVHDEGSYDPASARIALAAAIRGVMTRVSQAVTQS